MSDWDKFDFSRLEAREQSPPFPGASRQVRTDQRCRWYHKVSQWWMMIQVIIALPLRLHHETTFVRTIDTCYKKQPLRLRPNCLSIIPRTMLDAVIISAALCHDMSSLTSWLTEHRKRKHMAPVSLCVVCWLIWDCRALCNYQAHDSEGQIASYTQPNIMIICQQQISDFTRKKFISRNLMPISNKSQWNINDRLECTLAQ